MNNKYSIKTRAFAMELLHKSNTIVEVAHKIGCGIRTVSRWYMDYLGYRGKEGVIEVKQSKINLPIPGKNQQIRFPSPYRLGYSYRSENEILTSNKMILTDKQ
ncbi:helix-turn-helix domain-containing protein [Sphingobacterium spiritivorum]|uniref:helix-turn-helix domain-containing protein n=1 Tax=Sphingobacterium spiritivorum TaxID=258 RepID=UPI003DA3E44B